MLIEINYQLLAPNSNGYFVAQRLVKEDDIISVDPKADEPNKSVLRVKGSGSQYVQAYTDYTLVEDYASFKSRYTSATASCRIIDAPAPAQASTTDCGGC